MRTIKRGVLAATLFYAFAVGTWAYSPNVASAEPDQSALGFVAISGLTVIPTLLFGTVDVVYGVQSEWIPLGWAIPQLLLGAAPNIALGIYWAPGHTGIWGSDWLFVPHFLFGAWFLAHSILSLALYEPTDDEADEKSKTSTSIDFGIAPIAGGAMGALMGTF